MADSIIGALRVVLGLDTAAFSSGAKEAQTSLDGLAKTFKTAIAGLSIGVLAQQFASFVDSAINKADELGKASQKFGVPIEQLSGLKYAAELADVSFEQLGKGLAKLSSAMLQGATNPASDAAKSFQALGISIRDSGGNIKDTGAVFSDIADKFSNMEDGAAKTALAIRLFGRAGAELIPLLNAGRDGIKAMTDEAKKLGIVISTDTAAKAEQFNDTLKRIHASHEALALQIAATLLPQLQALANLFQREAAGGGIFKEFISNLVTEYDIQALQTYYLNWQNFLRLLATLKEIGISGFVTDATGALAKLDAVIESNAQKVKELQNSFLSLGKAGAFDSLDNLTQQMAKVSRGLGGINEGALATKNAIDRFIESQNKAIVSTQSEAATLGAAVGVHEALRVTMEADSIAKTENIKLTDAQRIAIKNLSDQAGAAAVALAGAKLTQEFLDPWDKYAQKIRDINIELAAHVISVQTAAKASATAWSAAVSVFGTAAATTAGQFADLFKAIGGQNKQMFAIAKAFAISQAIINTYVGVTKAYAEGGVLGLITGAGVLAAGLAAVAKIMAEKPPTMAMGGSFMVGGTGGIDSKMVPIMATPGERVSVDQNKYGESTSAGKTLTVEGIKAKDYYRGDVLRDIIDNINIAIGDGAKIKMA